MEQATLRNVIGPQVRRLREAQDLKQEQLAARCQLAGLDITRSALTKIERGFRGVADHEVMFLAKALRVPVAKLFPLTAPTMRRKPRNPTGTRTKKGASAEGIV